MHTTNAARRGLLAVLGCSAALASGGCATVTGLVTGAPTGAIDAPAEIYRHHPDEFREHPTYWSFNILVFVPVGFVLGPVVGFAKGIAIDMEALLGQTRYSTAFGTYGRASIWRPYSFGWHAPEPD